jgi:carbon monoxide dehydrogenase subunit G
VKIVNEFSVSAPIEQAWDVLSDLEQVIPLMPGAQLLGRDGDDVLGNVKVKVGPVTSEFRGKARFVEHSRDQHRAVIGGTGKETRGAGNAAAMITTQLHEDGGRTRVTVATDLQIVGKLAQFGSAMLQQVSEKLLGEFVERLETELAASHRPAQRLETPSAPDEPAPIDLVALAGGPTLRKYVSVLLGVLALLVLLWVLSRRRRR